MIETGLVARPTDTELRVIAKVLDRDAEILIKLRRKPIPPKSMQPRTTLGRSLLIYLRKAHMSPLQFANKLKWPQKRIDQVIYGKKKCLSLGESLLFEKVMGLKRHKLVHYVCSRKKPPDYYKNVNNPVGIAITVARESMRMNTFVLAKKLKVSHQSVSQTELGSYVPSDQKLVRYAHELNLDSHTLLSKAKKQRKPVGRPRKVYP